MKAWFLVTLAGRLKGVTQPLRTSVSPNRIVSERRFRCALVMWLAGLERRLLKRDSIGSPNWYFREFLTNKQVMPELSRHNRHQTHFD